jgi:hypothetical protein
MTKEFKYWKPKEGKKLPESVLQKLAMEDAEGGTEFEVVSEWYPLFSVMGKRPRAEIVKLWTEIYPERAKDNKKFNKLGKYISWWDLHSNFKNFEPEKHKIITLDVDC